jgi:anti-sigma factor RsiW
VSHLDDLAAALVDNELSHDERDRALIHITHCAPCRAEVDAQRRLKALLANQADPVVSFQFTMTLLNVPRDAAGHARPDVVRRRRALRRPSADDARSLRNRAATVSAVGLVLVAGVASVGGGDQGRPVRPPVRSFVDEHTATTGRMGPLNDPTGTLVLTTFDR